MPRSTLQCHTPGRFLKLARASRMARRRQAYLLLLGPRYRATKFRTLDKLDILTIAADAVNAVARGRNRVTADIAGAIVDDLTMVSTVHNEDG